MLNAYYDFRNDSAFTPWVSAGIGYARIHQKTTGISTWDYEYGSSGRESLSRSGSADNFAWSLGAGVRYDVTRISLWTSAIAILMQVTAV